MSAQDDGLTKKPERKSMFPPRSPFIELASVRISRGVSVGEKVFSSVEIAFAWGQGRLHYYTEGPPGHVFDAMLATGILNHALLWVASMPNECYYLDWPETEQNDIVPPYDLGFEGHIVGKTIKAWM